MSNIRLGVVGFGNMGTIHCMKVTKGEVPGMELTAICDFSEERCRVAQENYPNVKVFNKATELYKSGLCDVVIVATPHYDHPKLVQEAFSYGLNVITEKPAGVYTKQVVEMNQGAEKSGKLLELCIIREPIRYTKKCVNWCRMGHLVISKGFHGLLLTGIVHRHITTVVDGVQHGKQKVVAH